MEILNKQENIDLINKYSLLQPINNLEIDDIKVINKKYLENYNLLKLFEEADMASLCLSYGVGELFLYKNIILLILDNKLLLICHIKQKYIIYFSNYYIYKRLHMNYSVILSDKPDNNNCIKTIIKKTKEEKEKYWSLYVDENEDIIYCNLFKYYEYNNIYIIKDLDYDEANFSELDYWECKSINLYKLFI